MKTKLLFIIGGLGVGGKERQLIEIINNLPQDNFETQLVIKEKNGYYFDLIDKNKCIVHDVDWKGYSLFNNLQSIKYIKKLIQVINQFKPDIVVSLSIEMTYLYIFANKIIRKKPILVNFTIQDAPLNFNTFLKFKRFTYKFFKYVIANSYAGLKAYKQENLKNRFVLYNGLSNHRIIKDDKNKLREELKLNFNDFIISSIANLTKLKDHKTLIKTIEDLVKNTDKSIKFLIVGDGEKRLEILNDINNKGIKDHVIVLGRRNDVEKIIKSSDLTILCSFTEGISNSVIESMLLGVPVLASGEGGLKETIVDDYNGYLYQIGDYKSLSNMIIYLSNNESELIRLGSNAKVFVEERFTTEIMIRNLLEILSCVYNNAK